MEVQKRICHGQCTNNIAYFLGLPLNWTVQVVEAQFRMSTQEYCCWNGNRLLVAVRNKPFLQN